MEGRTACNPRQPVQQPDYDRKREQAESGIAVGSPSLDDVPGVLHTSNLLAKQSVVCDRRYITRAKPQCLERMVAESSAQPRKPMFSET